MTRTLPVLLLFILVWLILPGTHIVMDEGYRLLQAASLRNDPGFPVLVDYPGAERLGDAAGQLRPLPAHYGSFTDNRIRCFYSPALAVTAMPFTGRMNLLAPLLAGFLLWFVLRKQLLKNGFSETLSALIPLAGTPLLYMSLGFWSYPAAVLLAVLAVQKAEMGSSYHAYLLAGASALFRIEFTLLFPLVFFRLPGRWRGRIHPAIPAVILLLAGNWLFTGGHVLGEHLASSTSEQSFYGESDNSLLHQKLDAAGSALLAMVPGRSGAVWLIPGALVWLLWAVAASEKRLSSAAAASGLLICAAAALGRMSGGFGFLDAFSMKHPLMVFPALWLVTYRVLRKALPEVILLLLLIVLLVPMHTQGPFWGVRHLFLPLFLMIRRLKPLPERHKAIVAASAVTAVTSVLFLYFNRCRVEELRERTEAAGNAVIATSWMIPGWFTGSMESGTPVVYTATGADLYTACTAFRDLSPVIVSLGSDAAAAVSAAEMAGIHCSVEGEVPFGSSLTCVILSTAQGN